MLLSMYKTVLAPLPSVNMQFAGAHNTIVTSRAGKDLVSCLVSGLLTIGPRFGGAIDDAARYFQDACDRELEPDDFVEEMKKKGIRVPGIGHRIKSKVHYQVGRKFVG